MTIIINTREDLDALQGTPDYTDFMSHLKGSMTKTVDTQTYPEGYGQFDYKGEILAPIWTTVKDLTTIERFGFTEADFQ
jgi:hypothetical protein